jgi:hypothetical protein
MHGTLKRWWQINLLVVRGPADGDGYGDTALAREARDGTQVETADGTGKALDAPTCHLTVGTSAHHAIERADAVTAPQGQRAPASHVREARHQVWTHLLARDHCWSFWHQQRRQQGHHQDLLVRQSCHRSQFQQSTCRSPLCQGRCG